MKRRYQIDPQRAVQQFRQFAREENPNLQMIFPMAEVVGLLQEGVGHLSGDSIVIDCHGQRGFEEDRCRGSEGRVAYATDRLPSWARDPNHCRRREPCIAATAITKSVLDFLLTDHGRFKQRTGAKPGVQYWIFSKSKKEIRDNALPTVFGEMSAAALGKCEANRMFRAFKEKVKRRIRYHLNRQLSEATKDIEFARQFRAAQESAEFADQHMRMAKSYPDKFALLKSAIEQVGIQGSYCEFGVYRGETLNFIASLVTVEVHGFDSFEGLPEDWKQGHEKGTFALASLPQVQPSVRLHKGWFQDTIPAFREQHPEQVAFLHLDADLYGSTRTVFELLGDAIVPGTVIVFDEFFNYPGWCEGEYKAFMEFCRERGAEVCYLGFARKGEQVAAKIARIAPVSKKAVAEEVKVA